MKGLQVANKSATSGWQQSTHDNFLHVETVMDNPNWDPDLRCKQTQANEKKSNFLKSTLRPPATIVRCQHNRPTAIGQRFTEIYSLQIARQAGTKKPALISTFIPLESPVVHSRPVLLPIPLQFPPNHGLCTLNILLRRRPIAAPHLLLRAESRCAACSSRPCTCRAYDCR